MDWNVDVKSAAGVGAGGVLRCSCSFKARSLRSSCILLSIDILESRI